ncbi:MAG: alpha/beta hydrolase [Desulfuromonadales bacterium]|nr:alpha/beta hydrolase [Desulfuromonadales bacterium]
MSDKSSPPLYRQLRFRLVLYLLAALIFAMPARAALEQSFIYFPSAEHEYTPRDAGLEYEEISFSAADGVRLSGWLLPTERQAPVVLFCMGNAGNISHRLQTLKLLHSLGVNSFIFNYRGYGTSEGKPSEAGTAQDVAAALDFLSKRGWPAQRTVIFGRSLGAAVALQGALQAQHQSGPPAGLIMETPFSSITAMGKHHYPVLVRLLGWIIGSEYDNLGNIDQLQAPLLMIIASEDRITPPQMGRQIFDRATVEKQLLSVSGADHNEALAFGGVSYRKAIGEAVLEWTGFESIEK